MHTHHPGALSRALLRATLLAHLLAPLAAGCTEEDTTPPIPPNLAL